MPAATAEEVASVLAQLDVAHMDNMLKQQVTSLLHRAARGSCAVAPACPVAPSPATAEDDPCSLCLCSMRPEKQFMGECNSGDYVITTACGHRFHLACFKSAREHGTQACPLCRANLAPTGATPKKTRRTARPPVEPDDDDRLAMAAAAAMPPPPPRAAGMSIGQLGSVSLDVNAGYTPADPVQQRRSVVSGVARAREAVRRRLAERAEQERQQQELQRVEEQEDEGQADMSMSSIESEELSEEEHEAELCQMEAAELEREYSAAHRY